MNSRSGNHIRKSLYGIVLAGMILSLCFGMSASPTARAHEAAPQAHKQVDYATTRQGGWLDEIDMSVVPPENAVDQLQAGDLDVYAYPLGSAYLPAIQDASLNYATSSGIYYAIMYNPAICTNPTLLNPFADRKIREATNRLYNRDYINATIYSSGGLPMFFAIQTNGPDYADLAVVARGLENEYAFNETRAIADIAAEMTDLGATLLSGKWQYNGSPVTLIFLIRNDGDGTRKPLGDYAADQLEKAGFTVDRQYKAYSEAAAIWRDTPGVDCQWNIYTAGWSNPVIEREGGGEFDQMYLPDSVQGSEPFLSNINPDPVFQQVGDDLGSGNYTTFEQRHDLMAQALPLSLQDSLQVFIIDARAFAPYDTDVQVAADVATGIETAPISFYTARFAGLEGGTLKWGETNLFGGPWNPVAGSTWCYDQGAMAATTGGAFMPDPNTGLQWPLRAASAELTVQTGTLVHKTLDWVTLNTADTIDVPADAWVGWDATTQTFIPAGPGTTAKIKSVITYPDDMFDTVTWHDGEKLSVADFVMSMIEFFDRANPDSAIYDSTYGDYFFHHYRWAFAGVKITSTDPLVIETYTYAFQSDAELDIWSWWPNYGTGEAPWDVIAVANMAEAAGDTAYSSEKASALGIEQTNFIGGPSLDILDGYLDGAILAKTIPYAPTMGAYLTADDAADAYTTLKHWYTNMGHFWVGTGPYYLDSLELADKTLVLKNFDNYPDLADRWSSFTEPRIADVNVTGPDPVNAGDSPFFDISVTFGGGPYPNADIKSVNYLLYDSSGEMMLSAPADPVGEGQFQVGLPSFDTAALADGEARFEAVVVVNPVDIPTFAGFDFLVVNKVTISGNTVLGGVTLSYVEAGIPKTVTSLSNGSYSITLPYGWSGTVTPSLSGYLFSPTDRLYAPVLTNQTNQNFLVKPGLFNKTSPANGATGQPTNPTLQWGASSISPHYQYCIDTSNNNTCNAAWTSTGVNTSVALSGLTPGTTYYWQVRAWNSAGTTYSNGGNWWSFNVPLPVPGAFNKTSPANGATGQPTNPTLHWGASSYSPHYQYCIDTSNNNACNAAWISTGINTSVALSGLTPGTTYYWQVRAWNSTGTTYANGSSTAWWSFSIPLPLPGAFNKTGPANGATGQPTNPTLHWGASSYSPHYQYCIDTSNNNTCNAAWISAGTSLNVTLSGLIHGTKYYWQVRAWNTTGTTYANGSSTAWWSFTVAP